MILMLVAVGALLAALGLVKFQQVQAAIEQSAAFQPPPEAVTTVVARKVSWTPAIEAIGTVRAVNGVTVSADLPGIVRRIAFESGGRVESDQVLVELDTRQEQAQLRAAEARLDLARLNFERFKGLIDEGIVPQADYDAAEAELAQASAMVGEIRATIERKTIRAPFAGVLGIRQVNLGQYLSGGDPVVPLQSLDPIHVDFAVPQQEIARIRTGGAVRVAGGSAAGDGFAGRVTAVDSVVDAATRNVQVQATLANPGARLRPGMFVTARVILSEGEPRIALPASAVAYAPYGDSVFLVEDLKTPDGRAYRGVRQTFVRLGPARGDQVAVLSGVEEGAEVVSSGAFKLRNGAAVLVNNEVQPGNDPAPTPADN
jgi:membrane fusion protein (multidrug efflux system)